jgi:hypothetical protein
MGSTPSAGARYLKVTAQNKVFVFVILLLVETGKLSIPSKDE